MNIVIMGAGKFGRTMCDYLEDEGHNVTVVDTKMNIVDRLSEEYDIMGVCGNGLSVEDLTESGADKADIFIATTGQDEINMVSALLAKKLGARHVIARVRAPLYRKQLGFMREQMGISMLVNPELDAAREIARMLKFPAAAKVETFAKGKMELAEVKINAESALCNLSLRDVGKKIKSKALICGVQRGDSVIIPNGDVVIQEGDRINLTAEPSELSEFLRETGTISSKIRSVMIVGGGMIGYYLAKILCDSKISVKIIEKDEKTCEKISSLLPKADVVCADGTNQDILEEEGIESNDAVVSLTGLDEENIIISLFAKNKKTEKIITKVNNSKLVSITENIGLESIVSPKDITASIISAYIRAKQNARQHQASSSIETLYKLADGKIEAIEFKVGTVSDFVGVKLKDLKFKKNIIIAGIIKPTKLVIPNGDSIIDVGDRVLVITTSEYIKDLSQIFE